ncbi:MAG: alpha/beta hydrolase [Nostocaceae cyanobacterium]|nr:alpha/beta hydrolase [Nostocaceae cyanobacterium]
MLIKISQKVLCYQWLSSLFLGILPATLTAIPVHAAEKIYFAFGPLDFSISLSSLETYAETGKVEPDLKIVLKRLNFTTKKELRSILQTSYDIEALPISQAFYDPMGETILSNIGELIQTEAGVNGKFALRAALIQAAESGDFNIIGVMRKFPTQGIRINTSEVSKTVKDISQIFKDTNSAIAQLGKISEAEAATEPQVDYDKMPNLRVKGKFEFSTQNIKIWHQNRNRTYPVDLYVPVIDNGSTDKIPVVVISHGLSSSRTYFAELAQFLASHGFMVAVPEHIGSNLEQREALLAGRARELFRLNEFIDRPLDVTYLLDDLERRNRTNFQGKLNLKQVGIIGHSFGGYTALVLAGATADFEQLSRECKQDVPNISLLLQCRALSWEKSSPERQILSQGLQDSRIQLVIALNPVSSSILGRKGISQIQIPVVMGSAGYDPATPVVTEQARTFSWLTTPEKYLVLAEGVSHNAELTALIKRVLSPATSSQQIEKEIELLQSNARAIMLAFLQVYINDKANYRPYVRTSYAKAISESPFEFNMVRSLTAEQWAEILK